MLTCLKEAEHRDLDGRLWEFLEALTVSPRDRLVEQREEAVALLDALEGKLLYPGWRGHWAAKKEVCSGMFYAGPGADQEHGEALDALHTCVTELVRFALDAVTAHRLEEYAGQLERAARDYISLRGHGLPGQAPAEEVAADPESYAISLLLTVGSNVSRIAQAMNEAGFEVSRSTLYGWPRFRSALRMSRGVQEQARRERQGAQRDGDRDFARRDRRARPFGRKPRRPPGGDD